MPRPLTKNDLVRILGPLEPDVTVLVESRYGATFRLGRVTVEHTGDGTTVTLRPDTGSAEEADIPG